MRRLLPFLCLLLVGCATGPNATGSLQILNPTTPLATSYRLEQFAMTGNGPCETKTYTGNVTSIDVKNLPVGNYYIVITAEGVGFAENNVTIKDNETTTLTITNFRPGVPDEVVTNTTNMFTVANFDSTQAATLLDVFGPDSSSTTGTNATITLGNNTSASPGASPSSSSSPSASPFPSIPPPPPPPGRTEPQRCISPEELAALEEKAKLLPRVERDGERQRYEEIPQGGTADFFIVTTSKTVTTVKLLANSSTTHCTIFAEKATVGSPPVISEEQALAIAAAVDSRNPFGTTSMGIYDRTHQLFGDEWLVNPTGGRDGDTKINLVLLSSASIGGENLFGFFRPADEETGANSNQGEILYLNASKFNGDMYDGLATIAHEFQHMINYNQKFIRDGQFPKKVEEATFDEGFSVNSEELNGFSLTSQGGGNNFMFSAARNYLAAPAEQSFFQFNNRLADYGAGYLYIRYLWSRFGESILRQLVTSPNVGRPNMTEVLKVPFPQVFQDWGNTNQISGLAGTAPTNLAYAEGFNARGTFTIRGLGTVTLTGPNPAASVSNLASGSTTVPLLPWAVRFTRYTGGTGAPLVINVSGDSRIRNSLVVEKPAGTFSSVQP